MKKRLEIEKLLRWAYREELPKAQAEWAGFLQRAPNGFGDAWGSVTEFGKLMTVVDAPTNQWGVVPDTGASREPHPDAVVIAKAVESLDALALDFPDDWSPLADMGGLGTHGDQMVAKAASDALARISTIGRDGVRRLKQTPRRLVFKHAIMGDCPDWECEAPIVKPVRGTRGGAPLWFVTRRMAIGEDLAGAPVFGDVEMDGYNASRKRPYADAYHKYFLDPDPLPAAVSRAEYEVWHAALDLLAVELEGELTDHEPLPTLWPARPWEGDAAPKRGRVLRDLSREVV